MDSDIVTQSTPVFGWSQPGSGQKERISSLRMPARRKIVSHAARKVRDTMVANLKESIAAKFPNHSETAAFEKIRDDTGISLSSLQRITSGSTGPSIDTLADLAHCLGTTIQDLLTPRKAISTITEEPAVAQRLRRK